MHGSFFQFSLNKSNLLRKKCDINIKRDQTYVEVCGNDEVSEVNTKLPVKNGEPLDVGSLHVLWQSEDDRLLGGAVQDGGALVPELEISGMDIRMRQNFGLGLIENIGGATLSANPDKCIGA